MMISLLNWISTNPTDSSCNNRGWGFSCHSFGFWGLVVISSCTLPSARYFPNFRSLKIWNSFESIRKLIVNLSKERLGLIHAGVQEASLVEEKLNSDSLFNRLLAFANGKKRRWIFASLLISWTFDGWTSACPFWMEIWILFQAALSSARLHEYLSASSSVLPGVSTTESEERRKRLLQRISEGFQGRKRPQPSEFETKFLQLGWSHSCREPFLREQMYHQSYQWS